MASEQVLNCTKALVQKKWTIAFIESATAGKMSYDFSATPDSGKVLIGGMVCYNACMKEQVLEIPHGLIETFTPESAEVTQAMAVNFRRFTEADVCVAITGLTTPGGSETLEKPVGTIFIHFIFPDIPIAKRFKFEGSPEEIVQQAVDAAATIIIDKINHTHDNSENT